MTEMERYAGIIAQIKENIRRSRYLAARSVNRELLLLYYRIGRILSERVRGEEWGAKVLSKISVDIQKEFTGIRGFSVRNMKNMRQFYQSYSFLEPGIPLRDDDFNCGSPEILMGDNAMHELGPSLTAQFHAKMCQELRPTVSAQFRANGYQEFGQSSTAQYHAKECHKTIDLFLNLGFTHHILILSSCSEFDERFFYIRKAVENRWSVNVLRYHLDSRLYHREGKIISNFEKTLSPDLKKHALEAFRDEYLLNFINIRDDENEGVLEEAIVKNVKEFMMSMGGNMTFVGNQYRLVVGGDEFFIDLLFFHRLLQAMVAVELKSGKFRPEYAGKMNFYLTALDRLVKLPHENPSVGIVLCRSQNGVVVEFAFSDLGKPMGAATYRTGDELPEEMRRHLPGREDFRRLFEKE